MNADWHRKHPMPKRPSVDDRVSWHLAHAKACACREIPPTVVAELERRGLASGAGGARPGTRRTKEK